ncbi:M48 family metallopeptidase [Edaphobacter bradus]|uniref:M48 family metallopeptidase n=1 Tax=Edaphobacter bradus TaxID=2259016 RepID=UPI0021DF8846|nr:M48 family metallopeptidase [Edaphobacter bradus]
MPSAWARFQPVTCKNAFTEEQEITEGRKVAAQVFQQMPVLPDSSPVSQYVRQLGARLVAHAPGYKWPYDFHVVASEEINAFALPGGSIFVNMGTIRAAETEAQLAGVMAHETSHVVMRHSTCNLTKQQQIGTFAGLGQLGAAILLGDGALGSMATKGIGIATGLSFLRMSRDYEKQADLLGTGILYDTGYDPRGMPQFFETIEAKYGQGGAQLLSDHPNPGNRTQYVTAEIATLPPQQNPKVTSAEFTRVRALAMKEQVYTAKEVETGAWRQTGHYAAVAGGPAQVIAGQAVQATGASGTGVRLSRSALGLSDNFVTIQGSGFAVSCPASWQKGTGQNGSVALVPQNGAGQAGIAYGVVIDGARWKGGVGDANSLEQATKALAQQLSRDNGGLQQASRISSINVNGRMGNSVELRGKSPVVDGGSALAERDWLVTVARPDGDVSYLVFIAPEPDFEAMRPVFTAMLQSFRVR